MPRSAGFQVENSFVNAFITEATGLSFPENAVTEAQNCIFNEKGNVYRRPGFNFEFDNDLEQENRAGKAVTTYLWQNVGTNNAISFTVVQIGSVLKFYAVGQEGSLSSSLNSNEIDLTDFLVSGGGDPGITECSFSNGLGYLFVAHPVCEPFYVKYNIDTDDFTATAVTLQIRDFEGVEDGLATETRPSTLSTLHKYNLYNQGWYMTVRGASTTANAITIWDSLLTNFPSNADVWWYFKGTDDDGVNPERFRPDEYANTQAVGNTPAPKGHYILQLHRQDRSNVSTIPGLPVVSTGTARVSCNSFFAGRVFYSGLSTSGFMGKIYFSQIVERDAQIGNCYQQNDPTSEDNSDLLPSDGGVISITEAGRVLKLVPVGFTLLVFATNGVWSISGSEGLGFRANDYSVRKISSISTLTGSTFVDIDGIPIWWNTDGIYTVQQDQVGSVTLQNATDQKIRTYFQDIPISSKQYAKGAYNRFSKTVEWLFRSEEEINLTTRYEYNKVLVLNLITGGFYTYNISSSPVKINGLVVVEGISTSLSIDIVTDNSLVTVTDSLAAPVQVETIVASSFTPIFKYLVSYVDSGSYQFTFAEANNFNYLDWQDYDDVGVAFSSFFITGFKLVGEAIKKFQPTYIQLYFDNDNFSTVDFQGIWDYATSGNTGRWSSIQRISFNDSRYSTVTARRKVRGHGKTLQFRVDSVDNEPFNVLGWSTYYTSNSLP